MHLYIYWTSIWILYLNRTATAQCKNIPLQVLHPIFYWDTKKLAANVLEDIHIGPIQSASLTWFIFMDTLLLLLESENDDLWVQSSNCSCGTSSCIKIKVQNASKEVLAVNELQRDAAVCVVTWRFTVHQSRLKQKRVPVAMTNLRSECLAPARNTRALSSWKATHFHL